MELRYKMTTTIEEAFENNICFLVPRRVLVKNGTCQSTGLKLMFRSVRL